MKFLLTLNIHSMKSTKPLHQMTVEHPSNSLKEFVHNLSMNDFLIVNVIYSDPVTNERRDNGEVALNYNCISKIVPWTDRTYDAN